MQEGMYSKCVWERRPVCETREGWQLNSELTHDSTTSTHSVLYTAALTEPNSHFILIPLSVSLCASLYQNPSLPPLSAIHPSNLCICPSTHFFLIYSLYLTFSSPSLHLSLSFPVATLYPHLHFYVFIFLLSLTTFVSQTFGLLTHPIPQHDLSVGRIILHVDEASVWGLVRWWVDLKIERGWKTLLKRVKVWLWTILLTRLEHGFNCSHYPVA